MASGVKHNFGQSFATKSLASLNNNQMRLGNNFYGTYGYGYGYGQVQGSLVDPDGSLALKLAEQARKAGCPSIAARYEKAAAELKKKNAGKSTTPSTPSKPSQVRPNNCRPKTTVKEQMGTFDAADMDGNGKLDYTEFEDMYINQKEQALGRTLRENDPELAKFRQEAKNLFDAMSDGIFFKDISKGKFGKILDKFDRMDGQKDGSIDVLRAKEKINILKKEGDVGIFNGKKLDDVI